MSLSMSSRTVATAPAHISFSTDSMHPAVVDKSPNLFLTSDLEVEGGSQRAKLLYLNLTGVRRRRPPPASVRGTRRAQEQGPSRGLAGRLASTLPGE